MPTKTRARRAAPAGKAKTSVAKPRVRAEDIVAQVTAILQGYADKGVFRGFGKGPVRGGKAHFSIVWHYDKRHELVLDAAAGTLTFPELLPGVPARSDMYREFKKFTEQAHSPELPLHRRIEETKARLSCVNRRGAVAVTLTVRNGDFDYGARRMINAADEIIKDFLGDGPYFDYLVEQFGLDPDRY